MKEPNNPNDEKDAAAPATEPQPVNNIETLRPYIVADNIDEFNRNLIKPVSHDIFLELLEIALHHRAMKVITALSQPLNSDGKSKTKLSAKKGRTLLRLIGVQYAEIFRSAEMLKVQSKFLDKIYSFKYRDIYFAAITGNLDVFRTLTEIPEPPPQLYCPLIVYAAANNHVSLVRYLHQHKQDPHQDTYHSNAVIAAIINNATAVFDYLVATPFDPNMYIQIDAKWPCNFPLDTRLGFLLRITVCCKRFDQFVKLVTKGAKLSAEIIDLAVNCGAEDITNYCIEKSSQQELSDTMANAIHLGQTNLIRVLHSKGVSLDAHCPLFSAILLNNIKTVQELISRKADITVINKDGENVLFIAAKSTETLDIFEYLLAQLKATLTAEKLSEFLNTKLESGWNILTYLCNKPNAWESSNSKKMNSILTNLVSHGAALFEDTEDATSKRLTYLVHRSTNASKHYLNFLAANTLLQKFNTTGLPITYFNVVEYLFKYFNNISKNDIEFIQQQHPDVSALATCANNLQSLIKYKNIIIERKDSNNKYYEPLAVALASSLDNTCAILPTLVDEINSQSLQLLAHSILALPNFPSKSRLCLAIADRISAIADVGEFHDHKNFDVRLFIAKTLYSDTSIQQNESITSKIKTCNEALDFCEFQADASLLEQMQPTANVKSQCKELVFQTAIKFKTIWLLDYFITTCASPSLEINAIIYRCLQNPNPNEDVRKLIGKLLNKSTGNIPGRLLLLAYALTHFKVKQPEQTKTIFNKALAQLAHINYSEGNTFAQLSRTHPKEILIAALKIRVEFVKLFNRDCSKINIDELSSLTHSEFLSKHNTYILMISQFIQEQKARLINFFDRIEQACVEHLNQAIAEQLLELKNPETGKRAAAEEITGASSPKRSLDESYQMQLYIGHIK